MAGDPEILKQILGMAGTGGLSAASAMNPYAAIAGAIPQVFQGALGVGQMIKGAKLAKSTQRPWMDVPAAQTEALFNARNMANGQAPGLNTAMQQMAQAQAGSIAGIQNSGGGGAERLAALTMLDQNAGTQAQNLGAMQENYKVNQASNLQNQLMQLADTQQKQFMYNKDEPYRNIMEASKASTDSGIQNLHGSLTGLGGTFAASLTKRPSADVSSLDVMPKADPYTPVPTKQVDSILGNDPLPTREAEDPRISIKQVDSVIGDKQLPMRESINIEAPMPEPKGPFPVGYNPDTKETNPVAGPPNYNPRPGEPRGPFPIGYGGGKLAATLGKNANPKLYGSVFNNLMKQLNVGLPENTFGQKTSESSSVTPNTDGNDYSKISIQNLPEITTRRSPLNLEASPTVSPKTDVTDYSAMSIGNLPDIVKNRKTSTLGASPIVSPKTDNNDYSKMAIGEMPNVVSKRAILPMEISKKKQQDAPKGKSWDDILKEVESERAVINAESAKMDADYAARGYGKDPVYDSQKQSLAPRELELNKKELYGYLGNNKPAKEPTSEKDMKPSDAERLVSETMKYGPRRQNPDTVKTSAGSQGFRYSNAPMGTPAYVRDAMDGKSLAELDMRKTQFGKWIVAEKSKLNEAYNRDALDFDTEADAINYMNALKVVYNNRRK